jgi:hypothetical protein
MLSFAHALVTCVSERPSNIQHHVHQHELGINIPQRPILLAAHRTTLALPVAVPTSKMNGCSAQSKHVPRELFFDFDTYMMNHSVNS